MSPGRPEVEQRVVFSNTFAFIRLCRSCCGKVPLTGHRSISTYVPPWPTVWDFTVTPGIGRRRRSFEDRVGRSVYARTAAAEIGIAAANSSRAERHRVHVTREPLVSTWTVDVKYFFRQSIVPFP
jgi:hypothetical protein